MPNLGVTLFDGYSYDGLNAVIGVQHTEVPNLGASWSRFLTVTFEYGQSFMSYSILMQEHSLIPIIIESESYFLHNFLAIYFLFLFNSVP